MDVPDAKRLRVGGEMIADGFGLMVCRGTTVDLGLTTAPVGSALAADLVTLTLKACGAERSRELRILSVDPPKPGRFTEPVMPGIEIPGDLGDGV